MWRYHYRDHPEDELHRPCPFSRLPRKKGGGCQMQEIYGWGDSYRMEKKNPGALGIFLRFLAHWIQRK